MLIFSATLRPHAVSPLSPLLPKLPIRPQQHPPLLSLRSIPKHHPRRLLLLLSFASKERESCLELEVAQHIIERGERWGERETVMNVGERRRRRRRSKEEEDKGETYLYSFAPYPLLLAAALPGASTVRSIFGPFVELVKSWNLPEWLVHWGHPGNMAVVLFAMGGYGSYLGFRIKLATDVEEKAMAKDLHSKLLGGMFFFFALGATGGITALLTADKPILESPHAVTGLIGLSLLTVQTILPFLFEGNPGLRTVHGLLGSGIMILFLVHAALGLQLGLSF